MNTFSASEAVIAAMITPALLILVASSLIATALVRLARIVDRIRKVSETGQESDSAELDRSERRAMLGELTVVLFFCAIVAFVIAGFAIALDRAFANQLTWFPVLATVAGMLLIVAGCGVMLRESRLAVTQIRAELTQARSRKDPRSTSS